MVTCPILRVDLYIDNKRLCLVTMMIIIVVGYLILKFALNIKSVLEVTKSCSKLNLLLVVPEDTNYSTEYHLIVSLWNCRFSFLSLTRRNPIESLNPVC